MILSHSCHHTATRRRTAHIHTLTRPCQYVHKCPILQSLAKNYRQLNVYFAWALDIEDSFWYSAMRASVQRLVDVAKTEGIYIETRYPNYAVTGTSAKSLYGSSNAARLEKIRGQIDPDRTMELAGGFNL